MTDYQGQQNESLEGALPPIAYIIGWTRKEDIDGKMNTDLHVRIPAEFHRPDLLEASLQDARTPMSRIRTKPYSVSISGSFPSGEYSLKLRYTNWFSPKQDITLSVRVNEEKLRKDDPQAVNPALPLIQAIKAYVSSYETDKNKKST